ncbi:hypothetical protein P171DRAFT_68194 [Karstenula rhodostoma CBS 690.94]|uniref:Uncharacterized protein n=1 Tax=Karstenula rhodostoma CBS 690.94 TaxID=1392251 RepID=A0A9P4PG12_9PLEO|nr:hypothetical protein P171DRAFT_68194 [Karstenula rhodostoma CBS 690.94]
MLAPAALPSPASLPVVLGVVIPLGCGRASATLNPPLMHSTQTRASPMWRSLARTALLLLQAPTITRRGTRQTCVHCTTDSIASLPACTAHQNVHQTRRGRRPMHPPLASPCMNRMHVTPS